MMRLTSLAAILALLMLAMPASAAQPLSVGRFWAGFRHFWANALGSFSGVLGLVLGAGAIGLFIITRGKWLK